ncbi:UspA [Penicillium frequentans]|uniref:UspA n=1 Tax=Penicillium frequentans TaxID=3151616 RepID=A0AAD6D7H9_9EURO|nr:UspA [Penicillium glabrum]KAJ5559831.1 UspA [Penicillium glabrum]
MSAPPSPKPSFESDDRPGSRASMAHSSVTQSPGGISFGEEPRARSPRRKSIQFNVGAAEAQLPSRSLSFKDKRRSQGDNTPIRDVEVEREQRPLSVSRGLSPPPPKTYERGVSFDTFDNRDAADFSLTMNYKHKGYQSTRRSRTFLCGTDQNDYSEFALEWLLDELVDDGDEIVCLRAVEKDSRMASDAAIEARKYHQEAERLFEQVIQKNSQDEKAISLVLELAVGKVEDIIQRMIRIYEPVMLVVGTRGRNLKGVHSLLPGSVSKYCLQQSPIPVIVVRPSPKREKKKKKRRADPTRRSYNHILEMSEQRGGRIFDTSSSTESSASRLPDEEAAVAEALGLPATYSHGNSRSSLSVSDRSSLSHEEPDTPPVPYSLDSVIMKSPLNGSPASSEESVVTTEETKRSPSPYPRGETPSPGPDQEQSSSSSDETPSAEIEKEFPITETTPSESSEPNPRVSIPVIEVSDNHEPETPPPTTE